jgi:hypothetical protein
MEELDELIKQHGLQESHEYVIIPFVSSDGRKKRCFLLKRRFITVLLEDGHYSESPLTEAIKAVVRYPDIRLSEALSLIHKEETANAEAFVDGGMDSETNSVKTLSE